MLRGKGELFKMKYSFSNWRRWIEGSNLFNDSVLNDKDTITSYSKVYIGELLLSFHEVTRAFGPDKINNTRVFWKKKLWFYWK